MTANKNSGITPPENNLTAIENNQINNGVTAFESQAAGTSKNQTRLENSNMPAVQPGYRAKTGPGPKMQDFLPEKLKKMVFAEKYRILEPLKVFSAEADLYIAADNENQTYVLKYYRFNIEPKPEIIKTLQSISAGPVIKIITYGKSDEGRFFEIQEHAKYGSINDFIKNHEKLTPDFINAFISGLNECLFNIHSHNIIHRDIKPANILIRNLAPLELALTDFGISSIADATLHQTNLSRTITYSAPESITGLISKATDYWAFGLILLEMSIGRHPYEGMDDRAVMFSIATRNVPYAETIENEFTPIIKGLLTRDDKKRWQYEEVKLFTAGTISKIYFEKISDEALNAREKRKPYFFNEMEYYDFKSMAFQLACNWEKSLYELKSGRIQKWAESELRDEPDMLSMIICLLNDRHIDDDEKLFEFIYRCNPELEMIYKNAVIDHNYIKGIALKILKNKAEPDEIKIFGEIFRHNLIFKYHFITGSENHYSKEYKDICDNCSHFKMPGAYAKIILLSYFDEYKKAVIQKIINFYKNNVILKAPEGYPDIKPALHDIDKLSQGGCIDNHKIIYLAEIPGDNYISHEEFRECYSNVFKKFKANYKKNVFFETLKSAIVNNKIPEINWNFFLDFIDGKLYPAFENHQKIISLESAIDKIIESSEKKAVKTAFAKNLQTAAAPLFTRPEKKTFTIKTPQWINLMAGDMPLSIIFGIVFAVCALPTMNIWIIIFSYLAGVSLCTRFITNITIERSYFSKNFSVLLIETIKRANEIMIIVYIFGAIAGLFFLMATRGEMFIAAPFLTALCVYPAAYMLAKNFINFICENIKEANTELTIQIEPYIGLFSRTLNYLFWLNISTMFLTISGFVFYFWGNNYILHSIYSNTIIWGGLGMFLSLAINAHAGKYISKYLYTNLNEEIAIGL